MQYLVYAYDVDDPSSDNDFLCGLQWMVIYYALQYNAWILLYMATERTIAIFLPLQAKLYLRHKNIIAILVITGVLLFGLNIHFWITEKVQGIEPHTYCFYTPRYQHFGNYIWPWIDFAIGNVIPFVIILILNISIIVKMGKVYYDRRVNMNVSTDSAAFANMTVILVAVSTWFFITTAPRAVFVIIEGVGGLYIASRSPEDQAWFNLCITVVSYVGYLNNSFNFVLYIVTSSKFRKELSLMFSCGSNSDKYSSNTSMPTSRTSVSTLETVTVDQC